MGKRVVLGGVLGGVVLFLWGSISHILLPLGEVGLKQMPNEEPVISVMRANLDEAGLYIFPGAGGAEITPEVQQAWEEKYRRGPRGILVYHPTGGELLSPTQLLTELLANIAAATVAVYLLAQVAAALSGFGARVLFVTLLGLLSGLDVDISYRNWYGFPGDYTLAVMAGHVIGWCLAGVALSWLLKRSTS